MRFKSGRWTIFKAIALIAPFLLVTGCKSGTNLVSLPKMPSFVSWGKEKPKDADLAQRDARNLPSPPSAAAFNREMASTGNPNARPPYPNTGIAGPQPAGVPYGANGHPFAANPATGPGNLRDPMSPAYTQSDPRARQSTSGGFYDQSPPGFARTAQREQPPANPSGSYPRTGATEYPRDYGTGGNLYRDSRATQNRSPNSTPGGFRPGTAVASRDSGRFSQPAGYEYDAGTSRTPRMQTNSFVSQAHDQRETPARNSVPGGSFSPQRGESYAAAPDNRSACPDGSCAVPSRDSRATTAGGGQEPSYRPFGTGDLQRDQWLPSKAGPPPSSSGVAPAGYGSDAMAKGASFDRPPATYGDPRQPAPSYPETYPQGNSFTR